MSLHSPKEAIVSYFGLLFEKDFSFEPSYCFSGFTHPLFPVVKQGFNECVTPMFWGLIPHWVKSEEYASQIRKKTLNARSESIYQKPSFKNSISSKRCLIPVNGFFEWQHINNKKYPHYVSFTDRSLFCLAGIYDCWKDPYDTGRVKYSFSIITTEANDLMARVHNSKKRMPVIFTRHQESLWLDNSLSKEGVISILKPCNDSFMVAHKISPLISKGGLNWSNPDLIKPYCHK